MLARMEAFSEFESVKRPRINLTGWRLAIGLTAAYVGWLLLRLVVRPPWLQQLHSTLEEFLTLFEFGAAITLIILWGTLYWRNDRRKMTAVARESQAVHSDTLPVPKLSREEMHALKPSEFEAFVGRLFTKKGYKVKQRGKSGDLGVDLEVAVNGREAIVQCKRYRNTVGADVVRELYGTLLHERVSHAFLITSGDISTAARQWSRQKPLTLIDGKMLVEIAAALAD